MSHFADYLASSGEYGVVRQIRHPLVLVDGLPGATLDEVVYFENDQPGRIIALHPNRVDIALLSNHPVVPGARVARTGAPLAMQLDGSQRGQVINPLGQSLINRTSTTAERTARLRATRGQARPIYQPVPRLADRAPIARPFVTGSSVVDLLVPQAAGQRSAVFGDQKTGKTSFLLATARAHAEQGIVIYAVIGRPWSDLKRVYDFAQSTTTTQTNVIIVATSADDVPSLITLTPHAAMTAAEYWRDAGNDVLLILHDLSTHAEFHREIALVAGQFPGRESYPGDIFHEHARLLERAGNFRVQNHGEHAITCLAAAETVDEDIGSYIVSNLISITDGHLLFDRANYSQGRRPAVRPAASVTRVGTKVQSPLLKELHLLLIEFLAAYRRAESFSHFGAELSGPAVQAATRGRRLIELFAQAKYNFMPLSVQIMLATMIWQGWFDDQPPAAVSRVRDNLIAHYHGSRAVRQKCEQLIEHAPLASFIAALNQEQSWLMQLCQAATISK